MNRPLVTVLMALYNGGEYLKQTVQSVLDQTYDHFEFLIVNDCSTDDSLKIIGSFQDKRIRIHNNVKNLGQTPSLNIGVKLAKGDYFARIDGDDVALPQWLQAQVDAIEKYPDHSVISSYAVAIDEANRLKKVYRPPLEREDIILRSLIAPPIHHVGSILKKKDILEIGGYDDRYVYAADYDLWERLIRKDLKITTTPQVLVAIREHGKSVSRSEHGRRDLEEIKEIAGRNIASFVTEKFSDEEVGLFCLAHYDAGHLTAEEFARAVEITRKIYANLRPSLRIDSGKIAAWARKHCVTIYMKRIFSFIADKEYGAAKKTSLGAMKDFGPVSSFTLLWALSFLSGSMLDLIVEAYYRTLRRRARFQLGVQSRAKAFQ